MNATDYLVICKQVTNSVGWSKRENPEYEVGLQCVQLQRERQNSNRGTITLAIDNNNFAGAARFLVHFLAVPARLRLETSYFEISWGT